MMAVMVGSARAQQDIRLDALRIRLWPEFDNNDLLVIAIGQTSEDTAIPVTLTFTLPADAELHTVAQIIDGAVLNAKYEESGREVEVFTENGTFQIEYYLPVIEASDDGSRSYEFEWVLDYPVDNLVWEVQQPPGTGSLRIEPETNAVWVDEFGFPNYLLASQNAEVGDVVSVNVSYRRSISQLTVDYLQAQADEAHSGIAAVEDAGVVETGSRQNVGRLLFYVGLMGVLVTLMVIVAVSYLRKGSAKALRNTSKQSVPLKESAAGNAGYCTNCGARLNGAQKFCTECGQEVHK